MIIVCGLDLVRWELGSQQSLYILKDTVLFSSFVVNPF